MLMTKLSKLSPELMEDFLTLGKELNLEITTQDPILFFNIQEIKDKNVRKRAEKLLKQAEKEVQALAAVRLQHGMERTEIGPERAPLRKTSLPPVATELMLTRQRITVEESRAMLLEGNRKFREELERRGLKNEDIKSYDAILITCSDARCEVTDMDAFAGKKILSLQVAGNVVSSEIKDALDKLSFNGEVIVCGHVDCGACKAKNSAPMTTEGLLGKVDINRTGFDIFSANALNQAEKIRGMTEARKKQARVSAMEFNHEPEHMGESLTILGQDKGASGTSERLSSSAGMNLAVAKQDGKDLSTQTAHAIVISDPLDLGRFTNPRTILGAGMNEVFAVSAVKGKLGVEAIGSIQYSLDHVQGLKETPHIVILCSDRDEARHIESALQKRLERRGVKITIMSYDRESGEAKVS
jgi:carbonic anhydrase